MLELINQLKNKIFGIYADYPEFSPRKRRMSRELENYKSKMRRLDDFPLPMSSTSLETFGSPSTSRNFFKKPTSTPKSFMRHEIIDLSDDSDDVAELGKTKFSDNLRDEDWIDARNLRRETWFKRGYGILKKPDKNKHQAIIRKGRTCLQYCNNFLQSSEKPFESKVLNESFRFDDKVKYRDLIESVTKPEYEFFKRPANEDSVFRFTGMNGLDKKKDDKKKFSDLYKKRLDEINNIPTVDLTLETNNKKTISLDSDSDSDIKIVSSASSSTSKSRIEPVNSMKKRHEIVPVTNQTWIEEWTSQRSRVLQERTKQIEEQNERLNKFRDLNKQNLQKVLEDKLKNCRIQEVILLDEEEEETLRLPQLTEEHERIIAQALRPGPGNQVFIEKFNLRITRTDLQTLSGLNWLNDEVINFYTALIAERGNVSEGKLPKVHSMNTFFYPKLLSQGYSSLRRWTKKVDIFAQDMIVIPIHLGVHWCMSLVDFRDKTIKYFDSMGGRNMKCLSLLLDYIKEEHKDKKKSEFDVTDWKTICMRDIPQQMNGSDCGMFACMYAEFLTRNAKILFDQQHMPYFRKKMVYEIITGQLMIK